MNRRKFLSYVGCGCCGVILNSCSSTPITERKQLRIYPESALNSQAAAIYEKIKSKEKMSDDTGSLSLIKEIGKKIENSINEYFLKIDTTNPAANFDWEYILIENKKVRNAWCMPGGKIAVYTGMLEVTKNNDGLAAVMGHEIAHAVAKHSVERQSTVLAMNAGSKILDMLTGGKVSQVRNTVSRTTGQDILKIGLLNPFSRKQESEADYLGMIFASLSGYDIRETVKIWERMSELNKGKTPPEFMSTHPSAENRIKKINDWTNEIIYKYPPITS